MYNEVENVEPLYEEVTRALDASGRRGEVILVDDGSTDGTAEKLRELPARDARLRRLRPATSRARLPTRSGLSR